MKITFGTFFGEIIAHTNQTVGAVASKRPIIFSKIDQKIGVAC